MKTVVLLAKVMSPYNKIVIYATMNSRNNAAVESCKELCIHLQQKYIIAVHVGYYMIFAYNTLTVEVTWLPAVSGFQTCI